MESLKDYLNKFISLCNKNNVLEIILGKATSPSIFNTNIYSEVQIKSLFKTLKNPDLKYKLSVNNQKLKRFYYENNIIDTIIKNEYQTIINHYSKNIETICQVEDPRFDIQLNKVNYFNDTLIINSPNFNYSEEIEELEITFNNSISIIIQKSEGYTCIIQIYKPINIEIIIDIIKLFPLSSYS
jgi:hypothetical protein